MNKKILLILIISITILSCGENKNKGIIENEISIQLEKNEDIEEVFLGFKFGMDTVEFDSWIQEQKTINKLSFTLDSYAYEFKQNNNLKGINWFFGSKLHNDTLIGISLRAYEGLSSDNKINLNKVYQETVKEYTAKYGKPNYSVGSLDRYWFIKNLEINIK